MKRNNGLFYIVLNKKHIFASIAITSSQPSRKLKISTQRGLFFLCIWSQNQQVVESPMEENKTLSLVLPENWHFLRGDIKGFQVQII